MFHEKKKTRNFVAYTDIKEGTNLRGYDVKINIIMKIYTETLRRRILGPTNAKSTVDNNNNYTLVLLFQPPKCDIWGL